jgi:hypothetical protein
MPVGDCVRRLAKGGGLRRGDVAMLRHDGWRAGGGGRGAEQPAPRTGADVWLQMGHIYELQKDYDKAMEAYQARTHTRTRTHAHTVAAPWAMRA